MRHSPDRSATPVKAGDVSRAVLDAVAAAKVHRSGPGEAGASYVIAVAAGVISAGEPRPTSTARSAIWGETSSHRPGQIQRSGLPAICENTQDRIHHCVQSLRDVIDEETQNNITDLLQKSVLAPVPAVRNRVA